MLQETCPECHTPLFRRGKETFCPKCNRQVVIIESAEEEAHLLTDKVLESSEATLLSKIQEINVAMKKETDPEKLIAYGNALTVWLTAIEKLRKLRR